LELLYDGRLLDARVEPIEIKDERLRASWGDRIYRILLTAKTSARAGRLVVRIE
jgi:hypothetical protein